MTHDDIGLRNVNLSNAQSIYFKEWVQENHLQMIETTQAIASFLHSIQNGAALGIRKFLIGIIISILRKLGRQLSVGRSINTHKLFIRRFIMFTDYKSRVSHRPQIFHII